MNQKNKAKKQSMPVISDDNVEKYLYDHPDFFYHHQSLLAEMNIPHSNGDTESLIERQVGVLREKNEQAKGNLSKLIEIACRNEQLATRIHRLIIDLMRIDSLDGIFETLHNSIVGNFHTDFVAVRLFTASNLVGDKWKQVFVGKGIAEEELFARMIEQKKAVCGRLKHQQQVFLFGDEGDSIKSVVMLPLNGVNWGGIIAIGSNAPDRFQPGMGVELLTNMTEVLSIILDSRIAT